MARAHTKGSARIARRAGVSAVSASAKVAITLRLDAAQARQLQMIAAAENRTLTNYVETALIRDLALRDEANRVITMHVAPGLSERVGRGDIVRGAGEADDAYATRQDLLTELWSVPDNA